MYTYMNTYTYTYIYIYVYIYTYVYTYMYTFIYIYKYIYVYTYIYIYVYVYTYTFIHVLMYLYIYIYIYAYVYICNLTSPYICDRPTLMKSLRGDSSCVTPRPTTRASLPRCYMYIHMYIYNVCIYMFTYTSFLSTRASLLRCCKIDLCMYIYVYM